MFGYWILSRLYCLFHKSRAKTSCTDMNSLYPSIIGMHFYLLKIWSKYAFCPVVCMTDIIPYAIFFPTNCTDCHLDFYLPVKTYLPLTIDFIKSPLQQATGNLNVRKLFFIFARLTLQSRPVGTGNTLTIHLKKLDCFSDNFYDNI